MDKLSSRIRLLFLISILFIYFAFRDLDNPETFYFWLLIAFVYLISISILYFSTKKWKNRVQISKNSFLLF